MSRLLALLLAVSLVGAAPAYAAKALFDDAHAEDAGNADWVIDDNFPIPSPAQSGITPGTTGTYWTGAISSFGVALVKRGYTVHSNTSTITYGNAGNAYDLSNYDLFIVPEPNTLFSAAEATAILNFVHDGGGLIAISDHSASDRNNDGQDSPMIWNALDPTHALLGIHYGVVGDANNNIVQTSTNVATSVTDSITHGPVGTVTGLAFHNGTTMTLYPASNPTVRGEVWMTGTAQGSTTNVMAGSVQYGSGRIFFVGDSSPVDDGSARAGNSSIYDGWGEVGATDSTLFLNAALWATRRVASGDTQVPTITVIAPDGGETWKVGSTHAITWTASDNVGVTSVDLKLSNDGGATFPTTIATGLANTGSYNWTVYNIAGSTMRVQAIAHDAAGNTGSDASNANFTVDRWSIVSSAGTNGSISPLGTTTVIEGSSQGYTITPNGGFAIANVLVDGASVGTPSSYTFTNVTANHTIAASFTVVTMSVSTSVVGGGTITRDPDLASYPQGSSVQLTANPGPGWAFTGWSGSATGTDNPVTLTVSQPLSVTATFADVAAPAVTVLAPNGGESWTYGSTQAITWSASDNAAVANVSLEYSLDGTAGPWTSIVTGLGNSGTFDWTLPSQASTTALVRVLALDAATNAGADTSDAVFEIKDPSAGVGDGPAVFALFAPVPNPSPGTTALAFSLPQPAHAHLDVLDAGGRRVAGFDGEFGAGRHTWHWDGRLASGSRARAGLYFVRFTSPFGTRMQRLVRLD